MARYCVCIACTQHLCSRLEHAWLEVFDWLIAEQARSTIACSAVHQLKPGCTEATFGARLLVGLLHGSQKMSAHQLASGSVKNVSNGATPTTNIAQLASNAAVTMVAPLCIVISVKPVSNRTESIVKRVSDVRWGRASHVGSQPPIDLLMTCSLHSTRAEIQPKCPPRYVMCAEKLAIDVQHVPSELNWSSHTRPANHLLYKLPCDHLSQRPSFLSQNNPNLLSMDVVSSPS
jgi:hypothetical protein